MSTHEMKVSEPSEETTPTKPTNDDESTSETHQTDVNHLILNGGLPSRKENENNNEKCNKITTFSSEFVCELILQQISILLFCSDFFSKVIKKYFIVNNQKKIYNLMFYFAL